MGGRRGKTRPAAPVADIDTAVTAIETIGRARLGQASRKEAVVRANVMATWKRMHSGDYTAYVIQLADGTVDAWIEQAGSKRNAVSALNSLPVAMVAADYMIFKDAGGHACRSVCGAWEKVTGTHERWSGT